MLLASTLSAFVASATFVWLTIAIVLILLFIATANDSLSFAFWVTVAGFAVLQLVSDADPWGLVKTHPRDLAFLAAAYFPVGVLWSIYRWWRVLKNKAAELLPNKAEYLSRSLDGSNTRWVDYVNQNMPTAANNKGKITTWIGYWPISMVSYVLCDFLYEIGNWIYVQISGLYQRIADRVKASIING